MKYDMLQISTKIVLTEIVFTLIFGDVLGLQTIRGEKVSHIFFITKN